MQEAPFLDDKPVRSPSKEGHKRGSVKGGHKKHYRGPHPAGEDPEAQHRWDIAIGWKKDDVGEDHSKEDKRNNVALKRLAKANGGYEDWVFMSGSLVTEVIDALEGESGGLEDMLDASRNAAHILSTKQWNRFQAIPRRCVHAVDKDVISVLFSAAEPSWRTLLTEPKKGGTCVFFHIGTNPPTTPIVEMLTKMGWYGVAVCAEKLAAGNEDRVQHCELDPFDEDDEPYILKLSDAPRSLLPKPSTFLLAFADICWDSDNIDGDGGLDATNIWKNVDANMDGSVSKKEFRQAQKAGLLDEALKFKDFDINGDGAISKDEFFEAIKEGLMGIDAQADAAAKEKKGAPENGSGYGLLGVTWSPAVRLRLRLCRNLISVALSRLGNQGSLVITWHGIPHHPLLMFICAQLRPVFLRVHVLVPEGQRSWETWILAASFKKQEAEEVASKGGGGFMFKNFVENAYRCADLDDCLLWSLTAEGLLEEFRLGGGANTLAKGFNELWSEYAKKFRDLAATLGAAPPPLKARAEPVAAKPEKEVVEKPEKKAKKKKAAEESPKAKAKPKAAAPKAKPKAKPKPKAAVEEVKESEGETTAPTLPVIEKVEEKPELDRVTKTPIDTINNVTLTPIEVTKTPIDTINNVTLAPIEVTKPARTAMADSTEEVHSFLWPVLTKKPRMKLNRSRTLPDLASSLGCSPGVKVGFPNERTMGEKYSIVQRALDHLELRSKIVTRIERSDVQWAMDLSQTDKFLRTAEGKKTKGIMIQMPPEADGVGVTGGKKKRQEKEAAAREGSK